MTSTTVTGAARSPISGQPVAGADVRVELCAPAFDGQKASVQGIARRRTDSAGAFTLTLTPNVELNPAGTWYVVRIGDGGAAVSWTVTVPVSGAAVNLSDLLVDNPAAPGKVLVGVPVPAAGTPDGYVWTTDAADPNKGSYKQQTGTGGGGGVSSFNGRSGVVSLTKADVTSTGLGKGDVGLGNVDNTSDAAKPLSTAATNALAAKADLVGGVVPTAQIPAVALNTSVPVANQAAMLALTTAQVQPGDVAVRADGAGTFMLMATDPSVLANWRLLNAPTDLVSSVNGQTGTVVLAKGDVGLGNVNNTADVDKPISTATAKMTVTGVKSAAYNAAPGDIVPVDISGGSFPVNLPPATSKWEIIVKVRAATSPLAPSTACAVTANGTDVINTPGNQVLNQRVQGRAKRYTSDGAGLIIVSGGDVDITVEDQRMGDWLTGRLPSAFTPSRDLPGVFGWFSAADARKADGTVPANTDAVARLLDSSGWGNDLDQYTSAARPSFVASAVNGLPSIKFASGQYMRSVGDNFRQPSRAQPLTYICLAKITAGTANYGSIMGTFGDTTGANNTAGFTALMVHSTSNDGVLNPQAGSGSGAVGGDTVIDSTWHVLIATMVSTSATTWIDGAMIQVLGGHGTNGASGPLQLSANNYPIIGEIAEAGFVNAALTDEQIYAVTSYFNTKAGLGL